MALALEPYLVNFGRIKKGEAPVRYVSVVGDDKDSTKILSAEAKNKDIKAEINPQGYEGDKYKQIKISLLPGMKANQFRDMITVNTDHKDFKTVNINLFGEIIGDIVVSPRSFSFGFFEKSKAPEKVISLKANPPATFKVLKAEPSSPDVKAEVVTITEGKDYQVKARVSEKFDKDSLRGSIIITTDNKDQPTIEVMFFGRLQKAPMNIPGQQRPGMPPGMPMPPVPPPVPPGAQPK